MGTGAAVFRSSEKGFKGFKMLLNMGKVLDDDLLKCFRSDLMAQTFQPCCKTTEIPL